jgi:N utilization substance protein B
VASRRDARRQALDILYQADVTGADPLAVMEGWEGAERGIASFARELVEGVSDHLAELDDALGRHARDWTVGRMASVDRTILRLACYELRYREDVPPSVAISEAVEAAKKLSTDDSAGFVNGVLGAIATELAG